MSRINPSFLTKNIFDHVISDLLREREESGETWLYEDEFLADFKTRIKALEKGCDVPVHLRLVKELGDGAWVDDRKAYVFALPKTNKRRPRRPSDVLPKGKQWQQERDRPSSGSISGGADQADTTAGHNGMADDLPAPVDVSGITDIDELRTICDELQARHTKLRTDFAELQGVHYNTLYDACQEELRLRNSLVVHKAEERHVLRVGEQQLREAWGAVHECETFAEEGVKELFDELRWNDSEEYKEMATKVKLLLSALRSRAEVNRANAQRSLGRFGRQVDPSDPEKLQTREASYADFYAGTPQYAQPGPSHRPV